MTRTVTDHVIVSRHDNIKIEASDDNTRYEITGFDTARNEAANDSVSRLIILFQNGPVDDIGMNGITTEAILAVAADRIRSFQAGPLACRENALALTKIEEAMHWLHDRTLSRIRRGVEGTHNA